MLGSKSTYFHQSKEQLFESRKNVFLFLDLKGYVPNEIFVYIKAFDYFCKNPTQFDGATIVKDLQDIPHLDLDAMLHDYHYLNYGVGAIFGFQQIHSIDYCRNWLCSLCLFQTR